LVPGAAALLAATARALAACVLLLAEANSRIQEQKQRAEENLAQTRLAEEEALKWAATAEATSNYLVKDMLAAAAPERARGRRLTVEEALQDAARRVDKAFPGQPDVRASISMAVGNAYDSLALYPEAEQHLRRALDPYRGT